MITYSATNAQKVFGELIMESQRAPVSVTRNGKPVAVVLSATDYQALKLRNYSALSAIASNFS